MSKISYDDNHNLLYGGSLYYPVALSFEVRTDPSDDVFDLGWQSQFPFFPDMHYYAFEEESPLFIFCENHKGSSYTKGLYVRSDYDLYNALFIVKGTDIEISLADAMTKKEVVDSASENETSQSFSMLLKDDNRIQIYIYSLRKYSDGWYLSGYEGAWLISDEFVAKLKAENIITE